jgi:hypothetical protein
MLVPQKIGTIAPKIICFIPSVCNKKCDLEVIANF